MVLSLDVSAEASPLFMAEAKKNYAKLCGICHGNSGNGKGYAGASLMPPPTDFTLPGLSAHLTKDKLRHAIKHGVPGTSMVGYARKLSDSQISAMTRYIRQQFMRVAGLSRVPADASSQGKDIYIEHCAACHGDNGNTAVWAKSGLQPAPRNFTAPATVDELSVERMIMSVTHGRPGTAMMAFDGRLSKDEIMSVVSFIRSTFMGGRADVHVQQSPTSTPQIEDVITREEKNFFYPGEVLANRQQGKVLYLRNCLTCHGKNGIGDGPRANFNRPRPRDFTSDRTRQLFNRESLFHAIKKGKIGTVMPAWQTVLSDQDVANIAEFVFTEFVQMVGHTAKKKTLN